MSTTKLTNPRRCPPQDTPLPTYPIPTLLYLPCATPTPSPLPCLTPITCFVPPILCPTHTQLYPPDMPHPHTPPPTSCPPTPTFFTLPRLTFPLQTVPPASCPPPPLSYPSTASKSFHLPHAFSNPSTPLVHPQPPSPSSSAPS